MFSYRPILLVLMTAWLVAMPVPGRGAEAGRRVLSGHVPAAVANLTPQGRLSGTNVLHLAIGLPLRNERELNYFIGQLYDPTSTNFHKYLTPPELAARFGPTEPEYQAVRQFVESNGLVVAAAYPNRIVLDVKGRVADIERAFQINLNTYRHPDESRDFYAPDSEPSVPAGLNLISVEGLSDFSRPRHLGTKRKAPAVQPLSFNGTGPNHEYAGNDFRHAYVPGTALNGSGQTVALLEYSDYFKVDITNYENVVGGLIGTTNYVPLTNVVVGGTVPGTANNGEVALDIEMVVAMAPKLSRVMVYEQSAASSSVLSQIQSDNIAKQVSSSWTIGNWSSSLATTWDNVLKLMVAQGQSYFQSAGDSDAYTGNQTLDKGITVPADSPYATIVGGTTLTMSGFGVAWSSETVWNYNNAPAPNTLPNEGSGGGISIFYAQPSWQTNISMAGNNGSTTMRNIPDVALTADDIYVCYNNGDTGGSSYFMGTSAAAPLWAGFTALVNQQAALGGNPPVGFLNPALYALATNANYTSLFHDTVTGNNIGTNTPGLYNAVAGYDLATGLGSPNGTNLINALASLIDFVAITNGGWTLFAESATPANGAIDPGETVTVNFTLQNQGTIATSNLVATLLASTNILAPGAPQSYGAVAGFGGANSKSFTFTAAGTCGSTFAATLQLQDGMNNLGTLAFSLPLGSTSTFSQKFDGVTAPALPVGWTSATVTGSANNWTTTTSSFDTAPNSAFVSDSASAGENALVTPVIAMANTSAQLTFRHNYNLKSVTSGHGINQTTTYYDGGVLEIKIGGGAFTDIVSAGGSFVSGGYNASIATGTDNPLAGSSAWVGGAGSWQTATVNLPSAASGQNIQLRWNCATATAAVGSATGWKVDSISLSGVANCLSVFTDVSVSQSLPASSLQTGQNLVYTLTVTNLGPQMAANVVVTDTVPANATFISAPGGNYSGGRVIFTAAALAANSATNFTLTLAPASSSIFTNLATVVTITPEVTTANNSATLIATQTSNSPPAISSSTFTNRTVECGINTNTFAFTVSGTAPLSIQWSTNGVPVTGATNTSLSFTNLHLATVTNVAVTVTNLYGSVASNALVTVLDTLVPVVTLNSTNPFYLELGSPYNDPGATASDTCAGSISVAVSGSVNTNNMGTNLLTYTANDGNGNIKTNTRTVIVRDTTPPVISWSFTNLLVAANSNCAAVMPDATGTNFIRATDLSGTVTITQSPTNNAVLPLGTNLIVLTAADPSGNKSYSTNQIVVRDQTPPVLALNGFSPMTNELGTAFVDPGVVAGDACSGLTLLTTNGSVNINSVGTNLLTYIAVDGGGNTNTATRTVIVRDTMPPLIVWSFTNLALSLDTNCNAAMPDVTDTNHIVASDLSGSLIITQMPTNSSVLLLGTNVVVITVSDVYGNTAYLTNTVVVRDTAPPVILLQPQSQTNTVGDTAVFTVMATACTPVTFQWFVNGAIFDGQTDTDLTLTNLQSAAAGEYFAVATAAGGSTTSAVVSLTIVLPNSTGVPGTNGSVTLSLAGTPGATYVLESTTNLYPLDAWLPVATNTLGTNGVWQFGDTNAADFRQRFYRLRLAQ
jgi:uncharacterized repeat protein (TIGR01451 family)